MSDFFVSLFFAAGVGAFVYSKLARRVGYGNAQNVWILVGVCFVLALGFFYSLLAVALNIH